MQASASHKIDLARELLDDIELSRSGIEAILLKTKRLASLMEAPREIRLLLDLELGGYYTNSAEGWKEVASWVGRTTSGEDGYWAPLSQIEHQIDALKVELGRTRVPDVSVSISSSNPHEMVTGWGGNTVANAAAPAAAVIARTQKIQQDIESLSGIRPRVIKILHEFVATIYYELAFSTLAQTLFEEFQSEADARMSAMPSGPLDRLPAVAERLATGNAEAISHAMTTCRRLIDAFANAIYPPRTEPVDIDGTIVQVGPDQTKNRLNCFVRDCIQSKSRQDRIRRSLGDVYDRLSTGVHNDVTLDEARALALQTYVTIGEIALLRRPAKLERPA